MFISLNSHLLISFSPLLYTRMKRLCSFLSEWFTRLKWKLYTSSLLPVPQVLVICFYAFIFFQFFLPIVMPGWFSHSSLYKFIVMCILLFLNYLQTLEVCLLHMKSVTYETLTSVLLLHSRQDLLFVMQLMDFRPEIWKECSREGSFITRTYSYKEIAILIHPIIYHSCNCC